jgi:hypothetical protein
MPETYRGMMRAPTLVACLLLLSQNSYGSARHKSIVMGLACNYSQTQTLSPGDLRGLPTGETFRIDLGTGSACKYDSSTQSPSRIGFSTCQSSQQQHA